MFTPGQLIQHRTGGPAWTADEIGAKTVICSRMSNGAKIVETFQISAMKPYEPPPERYDSGPTFY